MVSTRLATACMACCSLKMNFSKAAEWRHHHQSQPAEYRHRFSSLSFHARGASVSGFLSFHLREVGRISRPVSEG